MKKLLLTTVGALMCLLPFMSKAQTYSAWGMAVNQNNNMYDTLSYSGDSLKFYFPNTYTTAFGEAKLVVYYEGNFGNYYDDMEVFDETLNNIGYTNTYASGIDCGPEDSTVFTLNLSDINLWAANNSMMFSIIPSSGAGTCVTSRVRVRLQYNYCLSGLPVQYAMFTSTNVAVCSTDAPASLTGTPAGGTFSGPGVSGSTFSAGNLLPGNHVIYYTATDAQNCTTTGSTNVTVNFRPVVNNNATIYTCYGTSIKLQTTVETSTWYSDAALTNTLAVNSATFTTPTLTQTTNYWVIATDTNSSLNVTSLLGTGSATIDVDSDAGDDHGGIVVTKRHVYLNGDDAAVRYDLNLTPSSVVTLPIRDGMLSDLRTGKLWTLWSTISNSDPDGNDISVNALRGLDSNLAFTNEYKYLSQTIDMGDYYSDCGIFSGAGNVGLYSGNTQHWYVIDLDNGYVGDQGYLSDPEFRSSETWSVWGNLESNCAGSYSVIYRDNNDEDIHRRALPAGAPTVAGSFSDLSDLASLTFNPWNNRWYFHYEGSGSEFGGDSETLLYADATGTSSVCSGSNLSCVTPVTVNVPADVTLNFPSNNLCINNDAIPLNIGSPAGGTYSGIGIGTNSGGLVFYPALAGLGTFTISYTYTDNVSGCTDMAVASLSINACTGVEELTAESGISVYPNPNAGVFSYNVHADFNTLLIEVMDIQGRTIYQKEETGLMSGSTKQIQLNDIVNGMYILKMTSGSQQYFQRIQVIH